MQVVVYSLEGLVLELVQVNVAALPRIEAAVEEHEVEQENPGERY